MSDTLDGPITVKKLRELLIEMEFAGHGDKLVFLSRDPEGNGFTGFMHSNDSPGVTYNGVTWNEQPVVVLWAGAPEYAELEFEDD